MKQRSYYPELDGFRAVAVLMVLLYHSDIGLFNTGWMGVQFFFGLSGFLITGILINSKNSENYFSTFYARRFLRIFPLYYLVLFFCLFYGLIQQISVSDFGYYFFYFQNFPMGLRRWSMDFPEMLNHSWSLAIEEQFYLFAPLLVRLFDLKRTFKIFVSLIVFSVFFKIGYWIKQGDSIFNYTNTFSNLDMISSGCLLAVARHLYEPEIILKNLRNIALAYSVFYVALIFSQPTMLFPWQYPDMGTVSWLVFHLMLLCWVPYLLHTLVSEQYPKVNALLNWSPLQYIGRISYGLYLYHYLVFQLIHEHFNWTLSANEKINLLGMLVIKIAISMSVASLSWFVFEKPILSLKNRFSY